MKLAGASLIIGIIAGFLICKSMIKPEIQEKIVQVEKKSGIISRIIDKKVDGSEHIDETENYVSIARNEQKTIIQEAKNSLSYIPKYSFIDRRIYHSASYTYNGIGIYISENKEVGLVLTLSW